MTTTTWKIARWEFLHYLDRNRMLNDAAADEHDRLENELVEAGMLDDSGPQTVITEAGKAARAEYRP